MHNLFLELCWWIDAVINLHVKCCGFLVLYWWTDFPDGLTLKCWWTDFPDELALKCWWTDFGEEFTLECCGLIYVMSLHLSVLLVD